MLISLICLSVCKSATFCFHFFHLSTIPHPSDFEIRWAKFLHYSFLQPSMKKQTFQIVFSHEFLNFIFLFHIFLLVAPTTFFLSYQLLMRTVILQESFEFRAFCLFYEWWKKCNGLPHIHFESPYSLLLPSSFFLINFENWLRSKLAYLIFYDIKQINVYFFHGRLQQALTFPWVIYLSIKRCMPE